MVQNLQEVESMGTDKMDTKQEQRNKGSAKWGRWNWEKRETRMGFSF